MSVETFSRRTFLRPRRSSTSVNVWMSPMHLFISGTKLIERPQSRRTVFADGAGDGLRDGTDVELSHWVPNRTPARFKADTSTEICMNFVLSREVEYDLVVNNHADVDGVLSVFTLLHPEVALSNRATIVSAAEMGDFWAWGETSAQVLFQSLTKQIDTLTDADTDPQIVYERCLAHVHDVIARGFRDRDVEESLAPLTRSVEWISQSKVDRRVHHHRFAHYVLPRQLYGSRLDAALRVPRFNQLISEHVLFWPHARARWDREKVQLVSVEADEGWYHDLWYPGYLWAETPNSWRTPGLDFTGDSNGCKLSYPPLEAAAGDLQEQERNGATWSIEADFSLMSPMIGRGYPVVLSTMSDQGPAPSSLSADVVAARLAEIAWS
jgi:hypothetical protein